MSLLRAGSSLGGSAVQEATQSGAKLTAKQASQAAVQRGAKLTAKQASETAAQRVVRLAAEQAGETTAQRLAREGVEAAAEEAAEAAAKKSSKISAGDAALYAAGAAALGLGLYTYISADAAAKESNKTPRTITKVEYSSSDSKSVLKITFTPALRILLRDDLTFRDTKTTPVIDGPYTVKDVLHKSQIEVDFGSTQVVSLQAGGYIDVTTTVGNQAAAAAGDAGDALGDGAGGFLGGLLPDWLTNMGDTLKIILTVIFCIICGGLALYFFSKFF